MPIYTMLCRFPQLCTMAFLRSGLTAVVTSVTKLKFVVAEQ